MPVLLRWRYTEEGIGGSGGAGTWGGRGEYRRLEGGGRSCGRWRVQQSAKRRYKCVEASYMLESRMVEVLPGFKVYTACHTRTKAKHAQMIKEKCQSGRFLSVLFVSCPCPVPSSNVSPSPSCPTQQQAKCLQMQRSVKSPLTHKCHVKVKMGSLQAPDRGGWKTSHFSFFKNKKKKDIMNLVRALFLCIIFKKSHVFHNHVLTSPYRITLFHFSPLTSSDQVDHAVSPIHAFDFAFFHSSSGADRGRGPNGKKNGGKGQKGANV